MNKTLMGLVGMDCLALMVANCGAVAPENRSVAKVAGAASSPVTLPNIPQPVNELADGEYSWSQLLVRDAIAPIYNPQFVPVDQTPYDDNELVNCPPITLGIILQISLWIKFCIRIKIFPSPIE